LTDFAARTPHESSAPTGKSNVPDLTVIRIELTRASFFVNLLKGVSEPFGEPSKYDRAILLTVIDEASIAIDEAIADVDKLLAQHVK
jgi:hypothetical protein